MSIPALERITIENSVNYFRKELPQTVALSLTRLNPDVAAKILSRLPCDMITDVTQRMAAMDTVSAEAIEILETVTERELQTIPPSPVLNSMEATANILLHTEKKCRSDVLHDLKTNTPELYSTVFAALRKRGNILDRIRMWISEMFPAKI